MHDFRLLKIFVKIFTAFAYTNRYKLQLFANKLSKLKEHM